MEHELLQRFNTDSHTKEALKAYFEGILVKHTLEKAFARQDVSGIADAKEIIDAAFNQLEIDYGNPTKEKTITNEAR